MAGLCGTAGGPSEGCLSVVVAEGQREERREKKRKKGVMGGEGGEREGGEKEI